LIRDRRRVFDSFGSYLAGLEGAHALRKVAGFDPFTFFVKLVDDIEALIGLVPVLPGFAMFDIDAGKFCPGASAHGVRRCFV
jgi:hypothetical protein